MMRVPNGLKAWIILLLALLAAPAGAFDAAAVEALLTSSERAPRDKLRDRHRKPLQVLEFVGLGEGMRVLELYAAGGYYTVILSRAVGPDGRILAQNSPRALRYQEGRSNITAGEALARNIAQHALENVERLDVPLRDLGLGRESLDGAVLFNIFHDYYNRDPARAGQMLDAVYEASKPGAVVGLIDHHGATGADNRRLHRIDKEVVLDSVESAGFVVEAESDLLRNPRDSRRRSVFDPALAGNTDRFLLRLRKPMSSEPED